MLSLTEEELKDHKSIQNIRKVATTNGVQFKFRNFNLKEVTRALETLNPNKSIGHDKIPPGVLKLACNVLTPLLTNILKYAYRPATGPSNGKGVYGCLFTRRITTVILKTIDLLQFLPPSTKFLSSCLATK